MAGRALWLSLIVSAALAGALSACATGGEEAAPTANAQCYWLSNEGAGWVARPDLADAELCFEMDSCSGGVGLSGGGCYKWARTADAPAAPWAELGLTPLARPEPGAKDIPPPEEIYEDEFEMTSESCFENCDYLARVTVEAPLYAERDLSSPLVGRVSAGECVLVGRFSSLSAPVRGVVLQTSGEFVAGDVIYSLAYAGEGYIQIWRRGEYMSAYYDDLAVQWDDPPATADPRVGPWLELTRSDGARGWARDAETSREECTFVRP